METRLNSDLGKRQGRNLMLSFVLFAPMEVSDTSE